MQPLSETLPPAIATYLATLKGDVKAESFGGCFLENAIVHHDGREYVGLPGIKTWMLQTKTQGVKVEVADFQQRGENASLRATVSGQSPGGSRLIDYEFSLSRGKISQLNIKPSEPVDTGGHNEPDPGCAGAPPDG